MALPYSFSAVTVAQGSWLDTNFAAVGALGTIPCVVTGTNALTLTQQGNTPVIAAYASYLRFSGVIAVTNTGAVTANVAGLGALPIYKDTPAGPVALVAGDFFAGNSLQLIYDPALNTGGGGFHGSTSAPPSGITTITAGTGIASSGGNTPTLSLAAIATLTLLANTTGGSAAPISKTLTAILDAIIGNAQGMTLYRNATVWTALAAGTAGQQLSTKGSAANPQWGMTEGLGLAATGTTQGTALALTTPINEIVTVSANTGVILPPIIGTPIFVFNRGGSTLNIYPTSGAAIDNNSVNAAVTLAAGDAAQFINTTTAQFYTA